MMTYEIIGYIAAFATFLTFYMKTMLTLRLFGLASNLAFITYAIGFDAYPILILHTILFPLNIYRLYQVNKLAKDVKKFSTDEFSVEWIIPYAQKRQFKKDEIIFRKGDLADNIYFLLRGKILIVELNKVIEAGVLFGEMSIFSKTKQRMFTLQCDTDIVAYQISEDNLYKLYYQNPAIGFYLTKIILNRMIQNKEENHSNL